MFKVLRSIRGLHRRFALLIFASVLVFLLYLLLTSSGNIQNTKSSIQEQHNPFSPPLVDQHMQNNKIHSDDTLRTMASNIDIKFEPGRLNSPSHEEIDLLEEKHEQQKREQEKREQEKREQEKREQSAKSKDIFKHFEPAEQPSLRQPVDPNKGLNLVEQNVKPDVPNAQPVKVELPPLATDLSNPYSGPRNKEQQAVVGAFMHAWNHYKKYAWGHDELKPLSKGWQEWMGVGLTIVDSLDTMYIMGLTNEFTESREWVAKELTFDRDNEVQLFEIVIRELGGLLSAYHLSGDKVFLDKAMDLGKKLYPCFLGVTPIPCFRVNLKTGLSRFNDISIAEVGTIQLEFRDLARSAQNYTYERAIESVSNHLHRMQKLDGLVACFINPHTGEFRPSSTVSVGASADSYYEYLIKQWLQTGKTQQWLKDDYLEAVSGIEKHLYKHSANDHLGFVGAYFNFNSRSFRRDMEHLACFLPGTLALGYMSGLKYESHLKMAENLTRTCYEMYIRMPTGLSPEIVGINMNPEQKEDFFVMTTSAYNLQRPETVESIFYMYRLTKDPKYREWGWNIFQAFEKYTKLKDGGYASISNVKNVLDPGYRDKMETFYLAETLKYLYLLFSDDPNLIPLDKFVINTEAHPLPVYPR